MKPYSHVLACGRSTLHLLNVAALIACMAVGASLSLSPGVLHAQPAEPSEVSTYPIPRNSVGLGMQQATASSTFATTSYADLPGTTFTFTPLLDPTRTEAPGTIIPPVTAIVDWSLDVTKATATTGICALFINGAIVANTSRAIDTAAKEGTMAEREAIALTGGASQVIKLQCKSGDTNTFTVNQGQIQVSYTY